MKQGLKKTGFLFYQIIFVIALVLIGNYYFFSLLKWNVYGAYAIFLLLHILSIGFSLLFFKINLRPVFNLKKKDVILILVIIISWFTINKVINQNSFSGDFSVRINWINLKSWVYIVFTLFLIPINEEIVFRAITAKENNKWLIFVFSNIIYSLICMPRIKNIILTFFYGLIMHYIYKKYANVYLNIMVSAIVYFLISMINISF